MENSKAEQKRQLEEHREQEAQLRREDAERGQRQMDILNRRHHEQLEAIREEAASSSSRWRDIGNVVGQVAGGIASRYIPGPMGYATRF